MNQLDVLRARLSSLEHSRLAPFAAQHHKNLVKPTSICLKLSERCNSKCVHCDIWKNRREDALTTEQWLRTLDGIRRWLGPANIVLTGGEIFLRRDVMAIVRHATRIGLVCEVLSNGLLIRRHHCEDLVEAQVDQVTISLDGVTPETHRAIRRVPRMYERIVRTVADLDEFRRRHGARLKILLKMVVMRPNLHEVVPMADWVRERGQADVQFQPIEQNYARPDDLGWFRDSDLWIRDVDALRTVASQLISRKRAGHPIRNTVESLEAMVRYFEDPEREIRRVRSHDASHDSETCLVGVGSMVISSNGAVRWCFQMPPAGNVREKSPQEIWEGRDECWKRPCPWRS